MKREYINFKGQAVYVGIDVHKRQWSVSIFVDRIHHRTFTQLPDPEVLKVYLDRHFPEAIIHCAYEATRFGFWIARKLHSYGYSCLVVNPSDIPSTNQESQNKTDQIDSRKIARTLQAGLLRGSHIPSEVMEGDRQLFRYRKRLWSDLVRVKNRIKGTLAFVGVCLPAEYDNANWSKAFLCWLEKVSLPSISCRGTLDGLIQQYRLLYAHFLEVSKQVRKLLRSQRYLKKGKLLRSIPGIGPLTSVQLLVEVGDIHRFPSFRQFNSFIGIKPTTYSSGDHDWKGGLTIRRHKSLRSAVVECAWVAIQKDPALSARYQELTKRMTGKRAIIVIARKLLSRIYHVWKNEEMYELGRVS